MGKDDTKFGKAFAASLERHGLNQSRAAEQVGVSRNYVSMIVSGKKSPSPARIDDLAGALGFTEEEARRLHRAAATDAGFRLDLPDDF